MRDLLFIFSLMCCLGACRPVIPTPTDRPAKADSLIAHANELLLNGRDEHFIGYLDSVYSQFPDAGPGDRWKNYSEHVKYYLNYKIDTRLAHRYIDSMHSAIASHPDSYPGPYAQNLFSEGDLLMTERRFQEAFHQYYQGLLFAREHLDSCSLSRFSDKLGLVKYRQGRYMEAIPYLQRALMQDKYCAKGTAYLAHSILNTIALCFERSGRLDSSITYYQRALNLLDQRRGPAKDIEAARGVLYGNLGGLYARLRDPARAESYLLKSIAINGRPGYEMNDAVTAQLKLADVYISTARYPEAATLLDQVRDKLIQLPQLQTRWLWSHWQYTERTAGPREAYHALLNYDRVRDSLALITQDLQAADMETAFRASGQQQKLALLTRDNDIKRVSLWFTLAVILLAIVIIWLVILSLRRSRRHNQILTQSREALREKSIFLEGLLNNLPVILYQIGPDGCITTAAGAGLNVVPGWNNQKLVGADAFKLAPDMVQAFQDAREGKAARAINAFRVNELDFYFDTIVLPDDTRSGGIIGFAVDLTENKRQAGQLEQLYLFKDKLLSVISHDLRQPLSAVLMATQLLELKGHGLSKADLEQLLLDLGDTAAKGISLLEGLLIWVRAGKANFQYRPQPIDLKDNIAEANGVYSYGQRQKGIVLNNRILPGTLVLAHHQMLLFINRNLISNAGKYSPAGGHITIEATKSGQKVIVAIRDQGPGMSAEQIGRLFKAQDRSTATTDTLQSAGIALSICADMIRQMNGRIWAESVPGNGSVFYYTLPLTS